MSDGADQAAPTSGLVVDEAAQGWMPHPRFATVLMKQLLNAENGGPAAVSRVRVPVGESIGRHTHLAQVETVYVLAGQSLLTLGENELPFGAGNIVPIPAGMPHSLLNAGREAVDLLCVFTDER